MGCCTTACPNSTPVVQMRLRSLRLLNQLRKRRAFRAPDPVTVVCQRAGLTRLLHDMRPHVRGSAVVRVVAANTDGGGSATSREEVARRTSISNAAQKQSTTTATSSVALRIRTKVRIERPRRKG